MKPGLVAIGGALFRLPPRIPDHVLMEFALTGERVSAERCRELGLVRRVVPPGAALDAAIELAQRISKSGPLAIAATKQILQRSLEWTDADAWKEQHKLARPALRSKDATEGARAFAKRRTPLWRGE